MKRKAGDVRMKNICLNNDENKKNKTKIEVFSKLTETSRLFFLFSQIVLQ